MPIRVIDRTYVPPEAELTITHRRPTWADPTPTWWLCTCGSEGDSARTANAHVEHHHEGPVTIHSTLA